ncbi:MAG: hypothetical protein ACTSSN_13215 [Candidatus Heimdallarchaeaceae archaeon]
MCKFIFPKAIGNDIEMINTVLGPISEEDLGVTLMHEHIVVNIIGADSRERSYTIEEVVEYVLPYLIEAKDKGCQTIVEATPLGLGRDLDVLVACSKKSGLNIVTCTGAWDGSDVKGLSVPEAIKKMTIDEIANVWAREFEEGIDDTGIKPGYIKLALGDEGEIFPLQEKLLRAGARTSKKTGMRIQCHIYTSSSVPSAIKIIEDEKLPYDRFIWVHADGQMDMEKILEFGKKGIWLQFDGIGMAEDFTKYPPAIGKLKEENLIPQLLFGQDSGSFWVKKDEEEWPMRPYVRFFNEFVPYCVKEGIESELINKVTTKNSKKALSLG